MNFLLVEFNKIELNINYVELICKRGDNRAGIGCNAIPASESQPIYFIQSTVII